VIRSPIPVSQIAPQKEKRNLKEDSENARVFDRIVNGELFANNPISNGVSAKVQSENDHEKLWNGRNLRTIAENAESDAVRKVIVKNAESLVKLNYKSNNWSQINIIFNRILGYFFSAMRIAPTVMNEIPRPVLRSIFSLRKRAARRTAKTTLSLSTPATWATVPYWRARK
jgi:hypothetical protein